MKEIKDTVKKIEVDFMTFFGKILLVDEKKFTVTYWGGGKGCHAQQTFILQNTNPKTRLKEGDYVLISQNVILIFENEDELREGLEVYINRNIPKEYWEGNQKNIETEVKEIINAT